MLEAVYLVLDILEASFLATLLTRFWSQRQLEASLRGIQNRHRRFGAGMLLLAAALLFLVPGTLYLGRGDPTLLSASTLVAYGLVLAGVYVLYSATWTPGELEGGDP